MNRQRTLLVSNHAVFSRIQASLCLVVSLLMLALVLVQCVVAQDEMPAAIAYQGYLTNTDGDPANGIASVTFSLYNDDTNSVRLWQETQQNVVFTGGVFSVYLGAVESLEGVSFDGPLWLGVSVAGSQELTPRVALAAVPFAMSTHGFRVEPGDLALNFIGGHPDNAVEGGVSGATISGGGTDDNANIVTADFGTISGGADNQAGASATVGGGVDNQAGGDSATIAGGLQNVASGTLAAVGGGGGNRAEGLAATISGGGNSVASGERATIGGGGGNAATAQWATVSGGNSNTAQGQFSVVVGGDNNTSEGPFSTVGGGAFNGAQGAGAVVPGGQSNVAVGDHSLAAGYAANASHDGAFVWADYLSISDPPFVSTAARQFLIRARGGVGIGTNAPEGALHVTNTEGNRDLVLGGTDDTLFGDDGVISSDPALPSSDLWLVSNDDVAVFLDADESGEAAEFIVADANLDRAFQVDLSGTVTTGQIELENELGTDDTPAEGGVYRDNVVYAWAHVLRDGTTTSSYGCTVSKLTGTGSYRITFKRQLSNGASAVVTVQTLNDPVIATAVTNANQADVATKVFNGAAFVAADYGFYVQVVGRP